MLIYDLFLFFVFSVTGIPWMNFLAGNLYWWGGALTAEICLSEFLAGKKNHTHFIRRILDYFGVLCCLYIFKNLYVFGRLTELCVLSSMKF